MFSSPRAWRAVAKAAVVYLLLAFSVACIRIARGWWEVSQASQHVLDKNVHLRESIGALETAITSSRKRQSEWMEQYSDLGRVQRKVQERIQQQEEQMPNATSATTAAASSSTHRLSQLLQVTELHNFRSSGSLVKSVSAAIAELQKLSSADVPSGSVLEDLLSATKEDRAPIQVCKHAAESLQQHMNVVLKDLKQNLKGPTEPALQALIEGRIAHHTAVAAAAATTTSMDEDNDDSNCFTNATLAMEWLEAGIVAIDRGLDIRRVLERAMETSGYAPPIFDAPLDPPSSTTMQQRKRTNAVTLRSILDRPTLHALGRGVDWLLDTVVSGHSTTLDWVLETYVYGVEDDEDFLVGPWLVHQVLERAGDADVDLSWAVL